MDTFDEKSAILSTLSNLAYMCGYILRQVLCCIQTVMYCVLCYFFWTEAPPLKLVKFTKKQVLEQIEALEGDMYSEVLTLTREEKDKQREQEKSREDKEAEERAAGKAIAEGGKKPKRKRQPKKVQEEEKHKEEG